MNACIVTCFESNEQRASLIKETFLQLKYNVDLITTNFSHSKKEKRLNIPQGYLAIDTMPYKKNLSIERMQSHSKFAKDAFVLIERKLPDVVWVLSPCNSLIKEANKYKKKHPFVKIIVDIIDMWPESLPYRINKNIFPLFLWRNLRRNYINCADRVVAECGLYRKILAKEYNNSIDTLYWCKESRIKSHNVSANNDELSLIYLGSINNIIDIKAIKEMISNIDKKVVLHIVGDGEKKEKMLSMLSKVCKVEYHGIVRDDDEKADIMSNCHAGINMYKNGLYIGLTMKCVDYFENGLPIINNISFDTWDMVEKYKVGINYDKSKAIDADSLIKLRNNHKKIRSFFEYNFSSQVFVEKCKTIITEITE